MRTIIFTLCMTALATLGQSPQSIYTTLKVKGVTYEGGASLSNYLVKTGVNGKLAASVIPAEALAGNTEPYSVVYVDSLALTNGNGSLAVPYNSLNTAIALKGSNSVFMCRPGNYGAVNCPTNITNLHIINVEGLAGPSSTGSVVLTSLTLLAPSTPRNILLSGVKASAITSVSNSKIYAVNGSALAMLGTGSLTSMYQDSVSTVTGFTGPQFLSKAAAIEYSGGISVKTAIDTILATNLVVMPLTTPTNAIVYKGTNGWQYIAPGTNNQILRSVGSVPRWMDLTNNVQAGAVNGQIPGWSTNETRYKPVTVPTDGWYALTNGTGGLTVQRVPVRPGTATYDLSMWDGYNWAPLPKGPVGAYLASTASGVGYVPGLITQGLASGDMLYWDSASTNYKPVSNNSGYTNRVLVGGAIPSFKTMSDYSAYDPRLPASAYMSGVATGSMLRWDPGNAVWSIVNGYTGTNANVFLRGGAGPAFTALPSIEAQGGITAASLGAATQEIWSVMATVAMLNGFASVPYVQQQDSADRAYAYALFESATATTNATMLRFLDRYAAESSWLEYGSGTVYQVNVITTYTTNYQWYAYADGIIGVTAGATPPYDGTYHPAALAVIVSAFATNLIAGATNAVLGASAGFMQLGVYANTKYGLASDGTYIAPAFLVSDTYYSFPTLQAHPMSAVYSLTPAGLFAGGAEPATGFVAPPSTSRTFTNIFGSGCWVPGGRAYLMGGPWDEEARNVFVFRDSYYTPHTSTNRVDLLAFTNGMSVATNGTVSTNGLVRTNETRHVQLNTLTVTNAITDLNGTNSIKVSTRALYDSASLISADWENRALYDENGRQAASWADGILYVYDLNDGYSQSVDWINRTLLDSGEHSVLAWENRELSFPSAGVAIDWSVDNTVTVNGTIRGGYFEGDGGGLTNVGTAAGWQNPSNSTNWLWSSDGTQITLTNYNFASLDVVIPDTLDGLPVTGFGAALNPGQTGSVITSVSGGNNITTIGAGAFAYCTELHAIELRQVTSIMGYAFYNCSALTAISLPQVTSILEGAFGYCSSLTHVIFTQNAPLEGASVYQGSFSVTNYISNPTATGWTNATWNSMPVVHMPVTADRYNLTPAINGVSAYLFSNGTNLFFVNVNNVTNSITAN